MEKIQEDIEKKRVDDIEEKAVDDIEEKRVDNIEEKTVDNMQEKIEEIQEDTRKQRNKKWIVATIVLTFLFVIYTAISIFFTSHYFFNTKINDESYSFKSLKMAKEHYKKTVEDFQITLLGRDNLSDTIYGEEIDLKYVENDDLALILKEQKAFLWITSFFFESHFSLEKGVIYDKEKLKQSISQLLFFEKTNSKAPINAYISENLNSENRYEIHPEYIGTILIKDKVEKVVYEAMDSLTQTVDLDKSKCYQNPQIYANNKSLIRQLNQYNLYSSAEITYQFGETQVVLEGDLIAKWLYVHGILVYIDEKMVSEYISEIAKTFDTYGKNRFFITNDGREKELRSGAYGWKIDQVQECKELISMIEKGEKVTREPVYLSVAAHRGLDDIGEDYIEIDLSLQRLYLYYNKQIVLESDIVSGNVSELNATPSGVYGISYRTKNAILRGDTWETHVNYWIPFNGGIGLHDATWRKEFGKDIYLANGSHGCINLPYSSAKEIYQYVYQGMPVICYY